MDNILELRGKNCQEEQRASNSYLMMLLPSEGISLHCEDIDIDFINFAEL